MTKKPKILLVTHQFTPQVSPRTTRWSILCKELVKRGYDVTVITGTRQEENSIDGYRVRYIGSDKLGSIIDSTRRASNNVKGNNLFQKILFYILKRLYRILYRTFAWPDYSMFWFFSIKKNRARIPDYDVLVSVSLPFTSHLVAYAINKKKEGRWIMDIGDPFYLKKDAPENNKYIYSFLNKYYENKFYKSADKVLFTHPESMKLHQDTFAVLNGKSSVLPPVFTPFNDNKKSNFDYKKVPTKIAYFGVLTNGVRTPDNLLRIFDSLDLKDIEIHWYVNEDSKQMVRNAIGKLGKNIFHDLVPREEAISLMCNEYHALLNIGNVNPFQLPSKVIEYISTGKPIIHFSEIPNDPVISILAHRENVVIISNDSYPEKVAQEIKDKLFTDNDMENVRKYDSTSLIDELINLI